MPRVQQKRGTAANLTSVDPTPLAGELLVVTDENTLVIGNGTDSYTSLAYVTATPRAHTQAWSTITDTPTTLSGYGITDAVGSSDARLTDSRTPTAHKASHATGGSDALSPSDIGAAPAASPAITGNATLTASSGVPLTVTNTGTGNSFVVNDASGDGTPFVINNSGSVGVGVATPAIPGAGLASIDASGPLVARGGLGVSQTSCGVLEGISGGARLRAYGATAGSGSIEFRTGGGGGSADTFAAAITSDQKLGVGTASPASRLDVNGVITVAAGSAAAPALVSGTGTSDSGLFWPAADTVAISTAGTERVMVKSTGAVRFVPLASDPASGETGDVYYNSANNKLRVYNGTSWVDLH